jgi:TetR/AcrR family transcriptional repressor of nem operon
VLAAYEPGESELERIAAGYLTPCHPHDIARGCPVAALAGETIRQSAEARTAMTERLRRRFARLSEGVPGVTPTEARQAAIGSRPRWWARSCSRGW